MISVVFAGTSDFAVQCLKYVSERSDFQIKGVITRPDRQRGVRGLKKTGSPVKIFSQDKEWPLWTPETASSPAFIKDMARQNCDLALVCAYGQILPDSFFKCFSKGAVNVHPSLLPRWRGAAPIERAIMAGDTKTGVSLQVMVKELDAGDLIARKEFYIQDDDSALEVYQKAEEATQTLLWESLIPFAKGLIQPVPQKGEVTFAGKIEKRECEIQWDKSAREIYNKIRALTLGPQAFSFFKGERIKMYRAKPLSDTVSHSSGTVVSLEGGELIVACGKGALSLLEVQRPGRKKQNVPEFLRGFHITSGEKFLSKTTDSV